MSRINAEQVRQIFREVIWKDGDGEKIEVVGVISQYNFSLAALEAHLQQISDLVTNLKAELYVKATGDEYISFSSARYDRDGLRWAGEDKVVEELVMLGIGAEKLSRLPVPREVEYAFFPGGNPLYLLTT